MIPAYRLLEAKTKIGELTLGQWAGVIAGVLMALGIVVGVRPFGTYVNLMLGVYVGGIPVVLAFIVSIGEFNLWLLLRSAIHWHRHDGRYVAGPGEAARGYRVLTEPSAERNDASSELDYELLWEPR